ncbi:MAG: histidine phosphotransferase family protein [Alphaproteobacteria bacterium]
MQIDIRILELLTSKICHDLVSPVGAINNGVELIEDVGGSVVDEAMKLIGDSATQASRRLRLFRLAYGRAGSEGNLTFKDMAETIAAHFDGTKIKLNFAPDLSVAGLAERHGALKVILNLILLADEALPYGGEIKIGKGSGAFEAGTVITAIGRAAGLAPASAAALDGAVAVDEIAPRTVHAYVTGKFMAHFGFKSAIEASQAEQIAFLFVPQ